MKILFFLIFLLATSADSVAASADSVAASADSVTASADSVTASADSAYFHILDGQERQDIHETFTTQTAGEQHTVSVCSAHNPKNTQYFLEEEGVLTINHRERQEKLVITMHFADGAGDVLQTSMFYSYDSQEAVALVTHFAGDMQEHRKKCRLYADISAMKSCALFDVHQEPEYRKGCYRFLLMQDDFETDSARPKMRGVIHGDAHSVDVTQYLFCSPDAERRHFIRMSVRYSNLREVLLVSGTEHGHHTHGTRAATGVCEEVAIKLGI